MTTASVEPSLSRVAEGRGADDPESAFLLFTSYKDRVYSFALRFVGDKTRAADITQDVFVKLLTRLGDYRGDSRFETWLYRIVANACIDDLRRAKRWLPWLATENHPALAANGDFAYQRIENRQRSEAVQRAISNLSPSLRAPILLRYMEDLSYEEIGEVLSISPGTVASRLNRAHRALAKQLDGFREGF